MNTNTFNPRTTREHAEGLAAYVPGDAMRKSNVRCPYPIGSGNARIAWMTGFFDAYFQAFCNRHRLGEWA